MIRRCLILTLLLVAALAGEAHALGPELGFADDRQLVDGTPLQAEQALVAWRELGVDTVRMFVKWREIAPGHDATTQPAGFHPADPNDPQYKWAAIDNAVDRVRGQGMKVMLTITGPGPLWTSAKPSLGVDQYEPVPSKFAAFATAVATRYRGRVERYILWNEPNEPANLYPQSSCTKAGVCTPLAPALYRNLALAAYPAIHRADPGVPVLIGALAPRGQTSVNKATVIPPLTFLRAMGCVSSRYVAQRSGSCKGFRAVTGDGLAYHPYGVTNAPDQPFPSPNDADLASLPRLESTLDHLQSMGALKGTTAHYGIYIDEYGYQTNPPDPNLGVTPSLQDLYLQQSAYMAWSDPRVKLFSQYIWIDELLGHNYTGFQSGLRYANGTPKPSLAHFPTPIYFDAKRRRLWGQERPGAMHTVKVQRRLRGSAAWPTIATLSTDARGYWSTRTGLVSGAIYRFTDGTLISGTTTG